MTIHDHLRSIGACVDARYWAKQFKTAREVYDNNTKINWLFWWAARLGNVKGVREAANEIANSVSDLKNNYSPAAGAAADAAAIAYATADAAYAAAKYASSGQRAAYAAYDKQMELNMQIAKKHCPLPWSDASDAVASEEETKWQEKNQ